MKQNKKGKEFHKYLDYIEDCIQELRKTHFTKDPTDYRIKFFYEVSKLGSGTIATNVEKDTRKKTNNL